MRHHEARITFENDLLTREDLKTELTVLRQSLVITIGGMVAGMLATGLGLLFAALKAFP
jgi:hypothetical protein